MKRIIGWIMILVISIAAVIMYAYVLGIVQTLLMFLAIILSGAWVTVAIALIDSGNGKKGTDNREEKESEEEK